MPRPACFDGYPESKSDASVTALSFRGIAVKDADSFWRAIDLS
jgi:hypothetical protein